MRVHVFNNYSKALWLALAATTVVSEVIPTPQLRPLFFYGLYGPAKIVCFLALGFLTPLAHARMSAMNRGIAFATLSSAVIECLQVLIGNGHRFHWYEMSIKLIVILFGFMFGLDARLEKSFSLGGFQVTLLSEENMGKARRQ